MLKCGGSHPICSSMNAIKTALQSAHGLVTVHRLPLKRLSRSHAALVHFARSLERPRSGSPFCSASWYARRACSKVALRLLSIVAKTFSIGGGRWLLRPSLLAFEARATSNDAVRSGGDPSFSITAKPYAKEDSSEVGKTRRVAGALHAKRSLTNCLTRLPMTPHRLPTISAPRDNASGAFWRRRESCCRPPTHRVADGAYWPALAPYANCR